MSTVLTYGPHERTNPIVGSAPWAHAFDARTEEGVPNQAMNFIRYATALGAQGPFVLVAPDVPDDEAEAAHIEVEMCDFRQIVETALGCKVYVQ